MKKRFVKIVALAVMVVVVLFAIRLVWSRYEAQQCAIENAAAYQRFFVAVFAGQLDELQSKHFSSQVRSEAVNCAGNALQQLQRPGLTPQKIRQGLDAVSKDCPPMGIYDKKICPYLAYPESVGGDFPCPTLTPTQTPTPAPSPTPLSCDHCAPQATPVPTPYPIPSPIVDATSHIIQAATAVGRLEIKAGTYSFAETQTVMAKDARHKDDKYRRYFWGTGVLVGPGIIATSCHAIESLLDKDKKDLDLDDGQQLLIDFGEGRTVHDVSKEFQIQHLLACSDTKGLDVALLQVDCSSGSGSPLPDPILLDEELANPNTEAALIGYADLEHPIDQNTADVYAPFKKTCFAKFVSLDVIVQTNRCIAKPKILLDSGTSTVGESGAVVLGLTSYKAIGFHTCCAAFFKNSTGEPPHEDLPCSQLERTLYNQAVSSWSVWHDEKLSSVLHNPPGCKKER